MFSSSIAVLAASLACTLASACTASPGASLFNAIDKNDMSVGSAQLEGGVDPNALNGRGEPALNVALERRSERLAQLLLTRGANPNLRDREGRPAIAFLSPLMPLAQGQIDTGIVGIIVEHASRQYVCARELAGETVKQVLARSTGVNTRFANRGGEQLTALIQAGACGHTSTLQQLLAAGAAIEDATASGSTALWYAAGAGYPDTARLLLDKGASVNIRGDGGATPLVIAAGGMGAYHRDTVQLLLKRGAQVNARDAAGDTALTVAARKDNAAVVELLMGAGADSKIANGKGETALSVSHGPVHEALERHDRSR